MPPVDPFFQVGGTLPANSPSYVDRPADAEILERLCAGEVCLVLAPRQSGKSSLVVQAMDRLQRQGFAAGYVDFQASGSAVDAEQWFGDTVYQIGRSLKLRVDCETWWKEHDGVGATQRFATFIEDVVLVEYPGRVMLFFDEIESVLSLPFSDDIFTTLRALFNSRSTNPELRRFTFALVGLTTPSELIRNHSRTPFNIGTRISLDDVDERSLGSFRRVLGEGCEPIVERILSWTNGQPLLVQKLASQVHALPPAKRTPESIDTFAKEIMGQRIQQDTHLQFMSSYLLDSGRRLRQLLALYRRTLRDSDVHVDERSPFQERLRLSGLVRVENRKLVSRCRLYALIFDDAWARANTPRATSKTVDWTMSTLLVVTLLWTQWLRPGLFPKFPDLSPIEQATAESSIEIPLSLAGTDVSSASLWRDGQTLQLLVPENGDLRIPLGSLMKGPNRASIHLTAGWHSEEREVPVEVHHYPGWLIHTYPEDGHRSSVMSVAFSPDGRTLASGSGDNTIKLWNVERGEELRTLFGHNGRVMSVAFSSDGKTLASGSEDHTIKLWNVERGEELRTLSGHSGSVLSVAFSPDGKTLASGSEDHTIKHWNVEQGKELRTLSGHTEFVWCVAFSPDGKTLASGSEDHTIRLWNVERGEELRTLSGHTDSVWCVAFSPDGNIFASGGFDSTIKLWNVERGEELRTLSGHSGSVSSVAFSPNGETLASGSKDDTIKLWNVERGEELRTLSGHTDSVRSVAFSPDGKSLASGSYDSTIKLWNVERGEELRTLSGHSRSVLSVAFSSDGKTLASGSADDTIKLWNVERGEELRTLSGDDEPVFSVAFSPDGKTLASDCADDTIRLWNVERGEELRTLSGHSRSVLSVAFSPDGKTLASGSGDSTIKIWNVERGEELRTLSGHSSYVLSVAFSPDGKTLASGGGGTIKLWNVERGEELHTLRTHDYSGWSVAFSPDGKTLASGSGDTIKLWSVARGEELRTFSGPNADVLSVAFSPDGKMLASGSEDRLVRTWRYQ